MYRLTVYCTLLCWNFFAVQTFNLASTPSLIIRKPIADDVKLSSGVRSSSLFGYTIVLRDKSILIGAPQAVTRLANGIRTETGAIYKCNLKSCNVEPYNFDTFERSLSFRTLTRNATHQWLGGAMAGGSREEDPLIICAPLQKAIYYGTYSHTVNDPAMHGVCYYIRSSFAHESNNRTARILSPFTDKGQERRQYHAKSLFNLIFGEFGFNVHITPNSEEILAGAPGVYGWSGSVVHLNKMGQAIFELGPGRTFEYTGYAVGSGYFDGNRRQLYYVTTQPNSDSDKKLGKAFIYQKLRSDAIIALIFEGQQYGEFYGYALLVEDVTGDGLDDILISAPYYSTDNMYDVGKVYIYINRVNEDQLHFEPSSLKSPFPNSGYFGASITRLGDINKDGYNDIAIGAPFAGADMEGAVAIYFGGPNGLNTQPRQILKASTRLLGVNSMFGLGLSKGVDAYEDGQNCLAIGAPNADTVFLYRSYPVVKINAAIRVNHAFIPLNTKQAEFEICVNIETNSTRVHTQEVILNLKADVRYGRINTGNCIGHEPFVAEQKPKCFKCLAKIRSDETSVFVPMLVELSYRLKHDVKSTNESKFCEQCAVVDPSSPNVTRTTIRYMHDCEGSVCVADLQLQSVGIPHEITLGSTKILPVKYTVTNVGERALYTKLKIRSSLAVPMAKMPAECIKEFHSEWKIICSLAQRQAFTGSTTLELSFDLSEVVSVNQLTISASVSSAGDEKSPADNTVMNTIELITAAEILITETTSNDILEVFNKTQRNVVRRDFELKNSGPSPLGHLNLMVALPTGYVDDKGIAQNYVGNVTAQVYVKDFIYPPMSFKTTQSISNEKLNATELLNSNQIPENRTTFLSCQPNGRTDMKVLCALGNFPLTTGLRSEQKVTLKLQYEIQWQNVEDLMLSYREYVAHVAMVDIAMDSHPNGSLRTKKRLKAALFLKIKRKSGLWIYITAGIGGLLLLIGVIFLLKRFGFFKRPTREAMEQDFKDKEEKAFMKEQLDEIEYEIDEIVDHTQGDNSEVFEGN